MDSQPPSSSKRLGTAGLDIFKLAGNSISGYVPSLKTGDERQVRQPYMSTLEQRLLLYLEYHPHVLFYQRGDVSPEFASARHLSTPLGCPYRIAYLYEGNPHDYLPDFVGTLCEGGLLIAEAGRESEKRREQALAKADAAQRLAQLKGGVYWIGTDKNLSMMRHRNLQFLHIRREPFPTYEEIATTILAFWSWGAMVSVNELIQRFGSRWSEVEVEAAAWKLAGDAASFGRLLVDLSEVELSLSTPLALLDPTAPPILPDPLPSSLEEGLSSDLHVSPQSEKSALPLELQSTVAGPTFDASELEEDERTRFYRNLHAVTEVLGGKPLRQVAKAYTMAPATLSRLVHRVRELGQIACVPHRAYHREPALHPEFQQLIRKLYTQKIRPSVMAIYEDVRLKRLAEDLSSRTGQLVQGPTYRQIHYFLKGIAGEAKIVEARSGLKHPVHEPMSPQSYVLSIPSPALICQVDEHTLDLLVVTSDGLPLTRRVHGAVLICVKTAAILGAVLALDSLGEEDYMRLLKQSLEPKDRLTALYECEHSWPCFGKPAVIFHDRGKIFTSERAAQVVVDRLRITTEQAPPYAPSAKGTVESLFTWTTRKFEHRLAGTTKATLQDRGAYDSVREALKAGITFDVLEKLFVQSLVDGYMQEWNDLRRQTPIVLWEYAVREKGLPRFMGSQDDLKLLLMKAVNRKNPATGRYAIQHGRLSFQGRNYVSPGLLDRLRGREIDVYFDRRDVSVIYLFLEGEFVGEAYCTEFLHRRVSVWEAKAERRADAVLKKEAEAQSLKSRQRILAEANAGRRIHSLETKRLEKQRQLDQQRHEIHPSHVQATLQALSEQQACTVSQKEIRLAFLPPAVPEDDPPGAEFVPLPVRKLRRDDD